MRSSLNVFVFLAFLAVTITSRHSYCLAATVGIDGSIPPNAQSWGFNSFPNPLKVNPGDVVVFQWSGIAHGIQEAANAADLNGCTSGGSPTIMNPAGSGNFQLDTTGLTIGTSRFYYCQVPGHCPPIQVEVLVVNGTGVTAAPSKSQASGYGYDNSKQDKLLARSLFAMFALVIMFIFI